MGHGASITAVAPPAAAGETLRAASATTALAARAAAQHAQRWLAIVDERVLARVHLAVETHVLVRVRRIANELEVASKLWFVKSISTTSIADAFDITVDDVHHLAISKRVYQVYNCGPELRDVPTLSTAAAPRVLELRDPATTVFLLRECLWTRWTPPTSWRMKADQVFDVSVHVRCRRDGFLTGATRVVHLRVGSKWVGPHHHNTSDSHQSSSNSNNNDDDAGLRHANSTQWLHRVDYEIDERARTAESAFFEMLALAWETYLVELARMPIDDELFASSDATNGGAFAYDAQDRATHLRVQYLLETSLAHIMSDTTTLFPASHAFERWRMAQEDAPQHRGNESRERDFAGPLLDAPIDELAELFALQTMAVEDVAVAELRTNSDSDDDSDDRGGSEHDDGADDDVKGSVEQEQTKESAASSVDCSVRAVDAVAVDTTRQE